MTTFVLVHGACHGGWCWQFVTPLLETQGHRVLTPTLTGLGDRLDEATPEVGLNTHVADIQAIYERQNLTDTILVGHSYGGVVAGSVADALADQVSTLIYLDAHLPENGRGMLDNLNDERRQEYIRLAEALNGWQVEAPAISFFGVTDPEQQRWGDERLTPHPLKCLIDPCEVNGNWKTVGKIVDIRCVDPALPHLTRFQKYAEQQPNWDTYQMPTGHDAMITEPEALAEIILKYAV